MNLPVKSVKVGGGVDLRLYTYLRLFVMADRYICLYLRRAMVRMNIRQDMRVGEGRETLMSNGSLATSILRPYHLEWREDKVLTK